jgi:drug/metabolite transporter (DMT)-like permease
VIAASSQRVRAAWLWTALFCLVFVVVERLGTLVTVSPVQTVWTRYGVHLVALALLFGRRPAVVVGTRRPGLQLACSLLMLGMPLGFIVAIGAGPVEAVSGVFWLAPLMALTVCVWRGEHVDGRLWFVSVGGWVSALLLTHARAPHGLRLVGGAVVMAACFALYLVGMRQLAAETTASKLFYTAGGVFLLLSLLLGRFYRRPDPVSILAMIAIGALGFAGLLALDRALELAPVSVVAPMTFMQPAIAFVIESMHTGHVGTGPLLGLVLQLALVAALLTPPPVAQCAGHH